MEPCSVLAERPSWTSRPGPTRDGDGEEETRAEMVRAERPTEVATR